MMTDAQALDRLALLFRIAAEVDATLSEQGMEQVRRDIEETGRIAR